MGFRISGWKNRDLKAMKNFEGREDKIFFMFFTPIMIFTFDFFSSTWS